MKRILVTILSILLTLSQICAANVSLEKPVRKAGNAFAIVIDNATYQHARSEVLQYRDALQDDGLSTWILSGDWETPDELRDQLKALRKRARRLEGIVLIGDIPVVMVRNAQHMTTAFKMDEEAFPRTESSVGSDRFYDSLDLEFEYLDKDENFFYYKLREDSPQRLVPSFYSGRIKCPETLGVDKYQAIAEFLLKAVDAKRNPQDLDNIVTYAGSGYNSDCLITWLDEDKMIRESFPGIKDDSRNLKQLNFRMDTYMKYRLFSELQRPEVDAMFFNEHGSIDKQHISNPKAPSTADDYAHEYKWGYGWVYSYLDHLIAADKDTTAAIAHCKEKFHLTDAFFEEYLDPKAHEAEREAAKATRAETIMSLEDLKDLAPQPRFVMFNACYNGSFHRPGSVSGYYIFGKGRTVATQGNTVNVLQDRWTYEHIGLLSQGCRVGEYNRLVATLEGHIIGDPTFHFNAVGGDCFRGVIAARQGDAKFWRKQLDSELSSRQSVALRMLSDLGGISADELLAKMRESRFGMVRMECLRLLSRMGGDAFVEALILGIDDDYELVRRNSAILAGKCGDPRLEEPMLKAAQERSEEKRVAYVISTSYGDRGPALKKDILNREAPLKRRVAAIRATRNTNLHEYIPEFLEMLADPQEDVSLRIKMAEALGWYTYSYRRAEIIEGCRRILATPGLDPELSGELTQTILRLQ